MNAAITCHFAQVGRAKKEKDEASAPELDEESAATLALALMLAVGQAAGTVTETAAETAAEAAAAMAAETRAAEQSDPGPSAVVVTVVVTVTMMTVERAGQRVVSVETEVVTIVVTMSMSASGLCSAAHGVTKWTKAHNGRMVVNNMFTKRAVFIVFKTKEAARQLVAGFQTRIQDRDERLVK